jgi:hypothetical protein
LREHRFMDRITAFATSWARSHSRPGAYRATGLLPALLRFIFVVLAAFAAAASIAVAQPLPADELAAKFAREVERRLDVPAAEVAAYGRMAEESATAAGIVLARGHLVLVDRDAQVQAMLLLWRESAADYRLVGAAPVSTGLPGSFDHFETPVGVFEHSLANPDFRAEARPHRCGLRARGGRRPQALGAARRPRARGRCGALPRCRRFAPRAAARLEPRAVAAASQGAMTRCRNRC